MPYASFGDQRRRMYSYAARFNNVANPNPLNRVWFDDVVVATKYAGPIKKPGTVDRRR